MNATLFWAFWSDINISWQCPSNHKQLYLEQNGMRLYSIRDVPQTSAVLSLYSTKWSRNSGFSHCWLCYKQHSHNWIVITAHENMATKSSRKVVKIMQNTNLVLLCAVQQYKSWMWNLEYRKTAKQDWIIKTTEESNINAVLLERACRANCKWHDFVSDAVPKSNWMRSS